MNRRPDERALRADVAKPRFGWADRGPVAPHRHRLAVSSSSVSTAPDGSDCPPARLRGFPQQPPTGGPWDAEAKHPACLRPMAGQQGRARVGRVQRRLEGRHGALPAVRPRQLREGHENWRNETPTMIWRPEHGITQYLEIVHELLNCGRLSIACSRRGMSCPAPGCCGGG